MSKRVFHQRLKPPLPRPENFHWPEGYDKQEKRDPDAFYPVPNRAMKRRFRFGGVRALDGSKPKRSRIQRGKSRPAERGRILREGLVPIEV